MRTHRTDRFSLVVGLLLLAGAGWWAVEQVVDLRLANPGWLAAAVLIMLGLLGLLGALRGDRRAAAPVAAADDPVDPVEAAEPDPAVPGRAAAPGDEPR